MRMQVVVETPEQKDGLVRAQMDMLEQMQGDYSVRQDT